MRRIEGAPVLTVAQTRAAEKRAAPTADAMYALMERAGAGVADAVRRLACGRRILVLCGPGNNGGDGYVAARLLREQGCDVEVAALAPPRTDLAREALRRLDRPAMLYTRGDQPGDEESLWSNGEPEAAPVLVDALFGTGARRRDGDDLWQSDLRPLFEEASIRIAVDLPLGLTEDGRNTASDDSFDADVTLALGALKQAHVLPLAMLRCGEVRLIDLGLALAGHPVRVVSRPTLKLPAGDFNKFDRGVVGVIAGAMSGAAHLAATAAARAGAGYVILFGGAPGGPEALVRRPLTEQALSDDRIGAFVIGPGLGRDEEAQRWLHWLIARPLVPLVIDADALRLLDLATLKRRSGPVILTPHYGEYRHLADQLGPVAPGGDDDGVFAEEAAVARAFGSTHVLVRKGSTTVITDGHTMRISPRGNAWLSTAGTGDVLAGTIGAMAADKRFNGRSAVEIAAAGVWLHAEAARRCGAAFIADDLAAALTPARASL